MVEEVVDKVEFDDDKDFEVEFLDDDLGTVLAQVFAK